MKDIQTEIARCVNQLLIKEPFFAHLLSGVIREYSDEIPTAAVGLTPFGVKLYINPDFFFKELKGISQRVAVIKHEALHLVFKHLYRDEDLKNHHLFNIAADLVVNQYIGQWELPESAITLEKIAVIKLERQQTLEYYYRSLEKWLEKDKEDKELSKDDQNAKEYLQQILNENTHSNHSKWQIGGSAESFSQVLLEQKLVEAFKRTPSKSYGTLPGNLLQILSSMGYKSNEVNWKKVLRIFASAGGKSYVSHTMKRVSKRYGTRPGVKIKRTWKLYLVIDTSGSIPDQTLKIFRSEMDHIHRCGAEITVVQFDTIVQSVSKYRPHQPWEVKGGGGTDFDSAFRYINSAQSGYGGIIFFTDGYACAPQIKPRVPLLWVITPDGNDGQHLLFGKKIKMNLSE